VGYTNKFSNILIVDNFITPKIAIFINIL